MTKERLSTLEETQLDLDLARAYHSDTIVLIGAVDTMTKVDSEFSREMELSFEDAVEIVCEDEDIRNRIYNIQNTREYLLSKKACHEAQIQELEADLVKEQAKAWVRTEAFLEELLKETNVFLEIAIADNEMETLDSGEPTKAGWRSERRLEYEAERLEDILNVLRGR